MIYNMKVKDRIEKLRKMLHLRDGSIYFTSTPHHLYYFTGFTGGEGYLLVDERSVNLFVDGRYTTQAKEEVWEGVNVILFSRIFDVLPQYLSNVKEIYLEFNVITMSFYSRLGEIVSDIEFKKAEDVVSNIRMEKDEYERKLIEKAIDIAQNAFLEVLDIIKPGVSERDIAAELCYQMKKLGADKESFDIIVASGYRGAFPHGVASDKKIKEGELIVIDWGAYFKGYVSDLTRMVVLGRVSEDAEYALQAVKEAQEMAIEKARCCMSAKEIDAIARNALKEKKLAEYFTHSLGHGIGVEIHEKPRVSYMSDEIIRQNVIFTVEPGVYIPGKFGVRIEDDVIMTQDGVEVLSSLDKVYRL